MFDTRYRKMYYMEITWEEQLQALVISLQFLSAAPQVDPIPNTKRLSRI